MACESGLTPPPPPQHPQMSLFHLKLSNYKKICPAMNIRNKIVIALVWLNY